jgi:acyl carrier protein
MAPEVDLGEIGRWRETRVEADLDSLDFLIFMIDLHERTDIEIPELDYPSWQPFRGAPPAWLHTRKLRR